VASPASPALALRAVHGGRLAAGELQHKTRRTEHSVAQPKEYRNSLSVPRLLLLLLLSGVLPLGLTLLPNSRQIALRLSAPPPKATNGGDFPSLPRARTPPNESYAGRGEDHGGCSGALPRGPARAW
jgi:hypothetical protein